MPVMSKVERAFCCGALWRTGAGAVIRQLPAATLGNRILEIGSGAGDIAGQLAAQRPSVEVTATDLDPVMLTAATRRLAGLPGVTVQEADATALPFADESYDSVLSCLMLHHVIDWEAALHEAARVLRPGGILVGYDLLRTPLATGVHTLDRSPFRLFDRQEFAEGCRRAGFALHCDVSLLGHVIRFRARR